MTDEMYRYGFEPSVLIFEVEAIFLAAVTSTEILHGETEVGLNAAHYLEPDERTCVIDVQTEVGRTLNRLFYGFLKRELGVDRFRVDRIEAGAVNGPRESIDSPVACR